MAGDATSTGAPKRMRAFVRFAGLAAIVAGSLSGCAGSKYQPMPVGVGGSPNTLKLSPAATMKVVKPSRNRHAEGSPE